MKQKWNMVFTMLLLAAFVVSRWPGLLPLNFSLVYAVVFCSGAFPRRLPWWLLLGTMLFTDIGLNLFYYRTHIFSDYQAVNYLAYLGIYWLGRHFSRKDSVLKIMCGGLLGAVIFYVVTNTAAWLQNSDYAKNISGWIQALTVGTAGWPETWKFFRNTLISGGMFAGIIASLIKLYEASQPEPEPETEEEKETDEAGETEPEEKKA